jgi:hypothetical protein
MLWRIDANERTEYADFPMGAGKEGRKARSMETKSIVNRHREGEAIRHHFEKGGARNGQHGIAGRRDPSIREEKAISRGQDRMHGSEFPHEMHKQV